MDHKPICKTANCLTPKRVHLDDLELDNDFSDTPPKAPFMKERLHKLDFIKIINSIFWSVTVDDMKMKRRHTLGKYLQDKSYKGLLAKYTKIS
jgi:hypothetical protein